MSQRQGAFRERIGTAAPRDIIRETDRTLISRYNYRYDRRVTAQNDMRFITQWNVHTPNEDEQARGITSVRTRIFVNARPKNRGGSGVRTYTVVFEAETEVQERGSVQWVRAPLAESREAYLEEIANYLENQLTSGVRTY